MIIGILAAVSVYLYIKVFSAKHKDPAKAEQINISAHELYRMFSNYEDSAMHLYAVRDKSINVSGRVTAVEVLDNRYTFTLGTGDDMGGIICEMDSVDNKRYMNIKANDSVNIVGFCNGILMDVQMFRCKLAE